MTPTPGAPHRSAALAIACAVAAGHAGTALAQSTPSGDRSGTYVSDPAIEAGKAAPAEPELRSPVRWPLGFDFGLGVLGTTKRPVDESKGGLWLDVHVGVYALPRLALLVESATVNHLLPADAPTERGLLIHGVHGLVGRAWLTPTLWLQAGGGLGTFAVVFARDDELELGPAVSVGIGGEAEHRPARAIDLALRFALARYGFDDGDATIYNLAASVGWHWY